MRVPDAIRDCVVFLCVKRKPGSEAFHYGGTAFLLGVPSERSPKDVAYLYLVTARHNIQKAESYGALYLRANLRAGGSHHLEINGQWFYPDDDAVDLAVARVPGHFGQFDAASLPLEMCATDDKIRALGIGIGDDLLVVGLFTQRHGTQRNLPIVRMGNVASMPDEQLEDQATGLKYDAYLTGMRSIGGLSGSPVFVVRKTSDDPPRGHLVLLGVIRGHWDFRTTGNTIDFSDDEAVNMGIATVTPIQEVVKLLMRDDLAKLRRQGDAAARQSYGTN